MTRRYTPEMEAWLRASYGDGDVNDTSEAFAERFGWSPSPQALYQKAHKLGLVKRRRSDERGKRVERTVRWSSPECAAYDAWMRENDRGHAISVVIDAFEREFGFRLSRLQVSQWRARNGVGRRRGGCNSGNERPIGYERDTGKGYVLVKVADRPDVPLSKGNWRMKHHLVWEEAHGVPVPEGHEVVFADRDHSNFDPSNLVAVDKRLVGILNANDIEWWDAESLQVAVARARLMSRLREVESGGTRTCEVCGARFEPTPTQAKYPSPVRTCPACLAAGKKARGVPKRTYRRVCAVCHNVFEARKRNQRRCDECIARKPKHAVDRHAAIENGRKQ